MFSRLNYAPQCDKHPAGEAEPCADIRGELTSVEVTDADLGDLAAITVGVDADPGAGHPSWGLQRIVVVAPDGKRWAFPCQGPRLGGGGGDVSTRQRVLMATRQAVVYWQQSLQG